MLRKQNNIAEKAKTKNISRVPPVLPTNAIAQRCGKEERQSRGNCATRMLGRHKLNAHGIGGAKEFRAGKRERSPRVGK
jgi:hypothetical protein